VPVTIEHADGGATVLVNQQQAPAIDGAFVSLGTYGFTTDRPAVVIVGTADTDGHVIADAVQFVPVADP
jgi:hypothetical protein